MTYQSNEIPLRKNDKFGILEVEYLILDFQLCAKFDVFQISDKITTHHQKHKQNKVNWTSVTRYL